MKTNFCIGLLMASTVLAQTPIEPRVESETLPSGGLMQIKLGLTSPHPITTGGADFAMDSAFENVEGVALMSVAGDAYGVAVVQGTSFRSHLVSPLGSMGLQLDYPFLMIASSIRAGLPLGKMVPVNLSPSTYFVDKNGTPYSLAGAKGGVLTIGGSVSISNVVPGGGVLPIGTVIRILGTGFNRQTDISVNEVNYTNLRFLSSTEMQLTLTAPANLTGKRIRAQNPDNSEAVYYSYLRAIPAGASESALLNSCHPLFAMAETAGAELPLPLAPANGWTAVALRNQTLGTVNTQLELVGESGALLGVVPVSLPPGSQYMRTTSELFGAPPAGSFLRMTANGPLQILGLRGEEQSGSVTAFPAAASPLTVNPGALSFDGGGSKTLAIGSTGAALSFNLESTAVWLKAAPTSGLTPASVEITADPAGLAPGSYTGSIVVSAGGVPSQTVPVTMTISSGPSLTVMPSTLSFTGDGTRILAVTSRGNPQDFSVVTDAPWLTASPSTAQTPAMVSVTATTAGLSPGIYTAMVTVGGQSVPVTLTVPVPPDDSPLRLTPSSVRFNYTIGGTAPRAQTVLVTGAAGMTFTAVGDAGWITVTTGRPSMPGNMSVTVNPQSLAAGSYTGKVTVTPASGKPQTLDVRLDVKAAAQTAKGTIH